MIRVPCLVRAIAVVFAVLEFSQVNSAFAGIFCRRCQSTVCTQPDYCCRLELQQCQQHVSALTAKICNLEQCLKKCNDDKECLAKELCKVKSERDQLQCCLDECQDKLKAANECVRMLKAKLCKCENDLEAAKACLWKPSKLLQSSKESEEVCRTIECLKEELDRCDDDCKESDIALICALKACQDTKHALDLQLAKCNVWLYALLIALVLALVALACIYLCFHARVVHLQYKICDLEKRHDHDACELRKVSACAQGAECANKELHRCLDEVRQKNVELTCCLHDCRTQLAFANQRAACAEERVCGVTRELAAHRHCCPPSAPSVVYGPVTPVGGHPIGGNPVGGNPVGGQGATAAGGPAGGPGVGAGGVGTDAVGTTTGVAGAGTASNSSTPTTNAQIPNHQPHSPQFATNPSTGVGATGTAAADSDAQGGNATAIA